MGCSASRPTSSTSSILLAKNESNPHPEQDNSSHVSSPLVDNSVYASSAPTPARAFSLQTPLVHHPPSRKGDSHHLVSLTFSTYGSLLLVEPINPPDFPRSPPFTSASNLPRKPQRQQAADLGESLSPDSVINTWELMDGLDDDLDFGNPQFPKAAPSLTQHSPLFSPRADSFQDLDSCCFDSAESDEIVVVKPVSSSKPLWKHISEEAFLSKMDPNVVSSYMRALSSRQLGSNRKDCRHTSSVDSSPLTTRSPVPATNGLASHDKEDKIVLYYTSLRGIRKTYEDCCAVRMIFRGLGVAVDERDISMDSEYRKELQSVLQGKAMCLPQVFIRGKHIGGLEEIRQLNEAGELAKLLEGFPMRNHGLVCESCGDARFVPCPNCSGSRKVFDADEEQVLRCPDCNENGLIRCPGCCS